jgi:AraC family transcriptional regulator
MSGSQLSPGQFYGNVLAKQQGGGLLLSEVRHGGGRRLPAHAHELAYFCLLLEGAYREQVGARTYTYKPLSVMFHPPGLMHRDEVGDGGGRFFTVELEGRWPERLGECGAGAPQMCLDAQGGELSWLAARLYREYRGADACTALAVEGLVLEMLAVAARAGAAFERRPPAWLKRATELLHAEFRESLTVNYLAAEVGVHPYHFSKTFRQFKRQTVGEYVHRLRVRYACGLLAEGERTLADVALAAGFADQSHFTRAFRRVTGMTPGTFRRTLALTGEAFREDDA